MKVILAIKSTSTLLMHAPTGVDPLHHLVKEAKKYTSKKNKTDEDHEQVAWYDFRLGLYYDEQEGKVVLPSANVYKCLIEAARMSKSGPKIERGVGVLEMTVPLIYDGPSDPKELFKDPNFKSRMVVRNQAARVMRTRPTFRQWGAMVPFEVDTSVLDVEDFLGFAQTAGKKIGLGDFRKGGGFGRFTVSMAKGS